MANDRLTPQDMNTTGAAVTRNVLAVADTYQVLLSPGGTILNFMKGAAVDAIITVVTPGTVDGLAIDDLSITVPANTGDVVAEFFPDVYANGDGDLEFTTDDEDTITCAVFQR